MTILARLLSNLILRRPLQRLLPAPLAAGTALVLLFTAAPAGAVVTTVGPTTVGLAPRISNTYVDGAKPLTYANPAGNPVLHSTNVYAVYWDPTDHYWSEWQNVIDTYLQRAGAESGSLSAVFSVDSQYTDRSNVPASYAQAFKGAYTDTHPYPTSGCTDPEPFAAEDQIGTTFGAPGAPMCLTAAQLAAEMEAFVRREGLPRGLGTVYYLLTPPGVTVCLDAGGSTGHCSDYEATKTSYENSFCSYHSDINPGGLPTGDANTLVYAVIPWTAGGFGDFDLLKADQRPGWECQDGGIALNKKGVYEVEKAKEKNKKEITEASEEDEEEAEEAREAEELEGPHEQEPNQTTCPNTNGACDYGLSDLVINQLSLEQEDMVTDPLLNAWQDTAHYENTDECRFLFGPYKGGSVEANPESRAGTLYNQELVHGEYYLNDAFNLAAQRLPFPGVACLHFVNLDPKFTAPNPSNAGENLGFDGMESDIALDAAVGYLPNGTPTSNYATYTWNFGDGSAPVSGYAPGAPACETPWLTPCAASVFHSYRYGGVYTVTLTVKDVGGNIASVEHQVTVAGPPPPVAPAVTAVSPQSTQSTTTSLAANGKVVPAPIAEAVIISRKLASALRGGVAIRYSVNEQVAGHFEILLPSSEARHLGISGSPALGMAPGATPQVVIAKAILITTKGGRSTVSIKFSKRTAARLKHLHSLQLTLRLIVRNAAVKNPLTTTAVSSATLVG